MYIYGKTADDEREKKESTSRNEITIESLDPKTPRLPTSNPTMIICCPNAGYYEFIYYEVPIFDMNLINRMNG